MRRSLLSALLALAVIAAAPARADEISDAIGAAQRAYQAGRLQETQTALQEAMRLLAERAAATLGAALPDPLPGWTAEEVRTSAAGVSGVFGAAIASRRYLDAQGRSVEIRVAGDNPMIGQLAVVMANPMLAGALGQLVRIGDQRAIQSADGNLQMLVDNRILVQVQGDAAAEAKLAYARAINLAGLIGR